MHYDLIIIGMGLSGLMAAKTAVEMGRKVLLLGKGIGSLCLFTNSIDVLGIPLFASPNPMKMKDGLLKWVEDHPEHPYAKVGLDNIDKALSSFASLFPPPYTFQTIGDGNCLIPTGAGTLRPTFLIPSTMVPGTSLKEGSSLFVGFKGFKDFYANYVGSQLKCRGVTLSLPDVFKQETTSTGLARLMEKSSFRETIGKEIKKHLYEESRVGLPALLGMVDPIKVKNDLEERVGADVFEIPILPPSIPGMRIFNRFKEWLIQKGVTFLLGHPVSNAILSEKKCEGIEISHPPVINSHTADAYILATGRFIGGGLMTDKEKIFEPLFNLPVTQPTSREDWFEKSFFNKGFHSVHQAGVSTNSSLQPVDGNGNLLLRNVWIAGSILAHHQCIAEKSREGIEIATGYWAAKHALEK